MRLEDGHGHLTYSTLVHPGDDWSQMWHSLTTHVPAVRDAVAAAGPFGVSLRLSGASVDTLRDEPDEVERLAGFLAEQRLYLFTVNAFPHGPFKGRRVMEEVYRPDWSTSTRVGYTKDIADLLARIAPADVRPSIQSAPLAFRADVGSAEVVQRLTDNVLDVVAHLADLERRTGRCVTLALEPEPACYLETTEETVRWFEDHVYSRQGLTALAARAGVPVSEATDLVRRHLGVVFDICHQTVGFEDVPESLDLLVRSGVPILKLQEAAALRAPEVDADVVAELERFTDTIYLSQTTELRDGATRRFLTLADAIDAWREDPGGAREWRTHFHVPVFLDDLGAFGTTRFGIEQALGVHARTPLSSHLEIETYTWDVLPPHLKTGDVDSYVVRELQWVRERLAAASPART
ncbi:metabolite traffic protein EboE [Aquipuribacter nitratireducens]|uniref:Metabolite traffic protein EboE n=1 Tax=Aquipuribacter nitratireducens TaxID=650104 RepID=A0ABW0GNJ3_9MICO